MKVARPIDRAVPPPFWSISARKRSLLTLFAESVGCTSEPVDTTNRDVSSSVGTMTLFVYDVVIKQRIHAASAALCIRSWEGGSL